MLASEDSDDVFDEESNNSGMFHRTPSMYLAHTCDDGDGQGEIDIQRRIRRVNRILRKRMDNYVQSLLLRDGKNRNETI